MKLSIIHNLYKKNKHVNESVKINIESLKRCNIDFEYILFNDNGDTNIKEDIEEFLVDKNVIYHYSQINYGKKQCSGGWVGAIPLLTGDYIHNTGQDDVFSEMFYKECMTNLERDKNLMLCFSNAFITDENLVPTSFMLNPDFEIDYSNSLEVFKWWFGVGENNKNEVTRANNNIPAPGVIYKKELHELIGIPDIDNFLGACDFEYWARVLFYGHKCKCINKPLWLYRRSIESASNLPGQEDRVTKCVEKIKNKYYSLYKERNN